mmetsp:Transcript_91227/g.212224  ORF Transcript_91227/g.212224 Transcript_91227/m.212224 type:complete len:83 (+) Transcript_91227:2213-2461(+)
MLKCWEGDFDRVRCSDRYLNVTLCKCCCGTFSEHHDVGQDERLSLPLHGWRLLLSTSLFLFCAPDASLEAALCSPVWQFHAC